MLKHTELYTKNIKEVKRRDRGYIMLNAILRIGLYIIVYLIVLGVIKYITHAITDNKEMQANQKTLEDSKAKYLGLLINSIKEFEKISRIKYPKYCSKETIECYYYDKIIDIKPQKLTILKRIEDDLLLVKCVSNNTRCWFYVDNRGNIHSEDEIIPIGTYEKIGEFTFEREKLL
jgi:hypothetical protein